ncbi:MAG: SRPBCC family protein [Verrucomicrobiales bacterium]
MTKKNHQPVPLIIERTFNAPLAQVWKALTDADDMREKAEE